MSRKTRSDVVDDEEPVATAEVDDTTDHHGFWDRAKLDAVENDDAFAVVMEADIEADERDDSLEDLEARAAMGNVTQIGADERTVLAAWAESKACRNCRRKLSQSHDPELLRHDECRTALRVARLLRRYN